MTSSEPVRKWTKRKKEKEFGLFATVAIKQGELVYDWRDSPTGKRTRLSTQIASNEHIEFRDHAFNYYNHACPPKFNIAHNIAQRGTYAALDIAAGEELFAFYPACEWEMDSAFYCTCASSTCLDFIGGAKFLPLKQAGVFKKLLSPHCKVLLEDKIKQQKAGPAENFDD